MTEKAQTPEAVALELMMHILLNDGNEKEKKSKSERLELYNECLAIVKGLKLPTN